MNALACSVVIPAWRSAGTIRQVVEGMLGQDLDPGSFEVIVVDDASPDDPAPLVAGALATGRVTLLRNDRNRGAGASRNRGLDRARGDIVVFSDSDCVPIPGFLSAHLAMHRRFPEEHVVVQGTIRHPPSIEVTPLMKLGNVVETWTRVGPEPVDDFAAFATTNVSLKRSFLRERFDEQRFSVSGWEDTELGLRLARRGMRIVTADDAVSHHHHFVEPDEYLRKVHRYGDLFRRWTDDVPEADRRALNRRFNFLFDTGAPMARNLVTLRKRLAVNRLTYRAILRMARGSEAARPVRALALYYKLYPFFFLAGYRGEPMPPLGE